MDRRLQDDLKEKQHNYIAPFLWLQGEDDELIINEIEKIYNCGIRSICLESRVHKDFCGEGWWQNVELILEECRKKDMNVWILDDKRFPSGYANGIFENRYTDIKPFGITETHMDVAGPIVDGAALADEWKTYEDDELVAVVACRHISESDKYDGQIIDLTEHYHDGMVYFSLPEGVWRIFFLMKTRSGIADRFQSFCDFFEPQAVKVYIEEVYEGHYKHFKEYFGNTFIGFFSDEPRFHNNSRFDGLPVLGEYFIHHPWHQNVLDRLQEEYGIDARKMLVGLWCDIGEVSDRIRYSYMNIISDEFRKNFSNQIGEWCRAHGVKYIGHIIEDNNCHATTGMGPGHYFRSLEGQDMAGIDVVLHQIIPGLLECSNAGYVSYKHMNNRFFHYVLAKLASSLAHSDVRKKGRAMCEIFGAYGWAEGTKIMKYLTDHMLVRGINYYVPHAFSPKSNNTDCPPNFFDSGNNPLYKYFSQFMNYMNRASYLLSDGIHVPMCAILYDAEARWVNREYLPLEDVAKVLYDNQLDYDILPADVLDEMDKEGIINGEKYPLLLVPSYQGVPEEIVKKLSRLPIKVMVVTTDMKERELLGDGKFDAVSLNNLAKYIRTEFGADVTANCNSIYLRYYHYMRNGANIYMFSNEDIHNRIRTDVTLSAFSGGKYILYDAFGNQACTKYSETGKIRLDLPPYHTVFVMCGEISEEGITPGRLWVDSDITVTEEHVIAPVFKISVAKEADSEYTEYKISDHLMNITDYKEFPHFSGNIKYEGTFEIASAGQYLLDLGQVGETVKLYINGIHMGNKIVPPYIFDISEGVHEGTNHITVIVSNHNGYEKRDKFSKFLLFEPSGLLGPLRLKRYI